MEKKYFELINEFELIQELDIKAAAANAALKGIGAAKKLPRPIKSAIGTGINIANSKPVRWAAQNLAHQFTSKNLLKHGVNLISGGTGGLLMDSGIYRKIHNLGRYHLGKLLGKLGLNKYKKLTGATIDTIHKHLDNIDNSPFAGIKKHMIRAARDESLNGLKIKDKTPLNGEDAHRRMTAAIYFNEKYGNMLNDERGSLLQGHKPTQQMHISDKKYDPDTDPMFADIRGRKKSEGDSKLPIRDKFKNYVKDTGKKVSTPLKFLSMDYDNPNHKRFRLYNDIKNYKKHQDLKNMPDIIGNDNHKAVMEAMSKVPYEQRIKTSKEYGFNPKQATLPGMEE